MTVGGGTDSSAPIGTDDRCSDGGELAARTLVATVTPRNPFAVVALPLIARLLRAGYRQRRRVAKKLVGRPAAALFRFIHSRLGLGGCGRMEVLLQGVPRQLAFNARNTQFRALYLPQYAGGHEAETAALLDRIVGETDLFVDIGANWGYYALFVASRPGYGGAIHAFEPIAESFADLHDLVVQSGLGSRITCHQVALSDRDGDAAMAFADGIESGTARITRASPSAATVPLARLDDIGLPPPSVVKIDVEGHEAAVLRGSLVTLNRYRPWVVFETWRERAAPETTLAPFEILARLVYVFFQPTWWRETAEGGFAAETQGEIQTARLALVPFTPDQRFLLADQFNALACPGERLPELAAAFTGTPAVG